jgi:hypothetical protein
MARAKKVEHINVDKEIWQYPKQIRWSTIIYNIKLIRSNHA